jgi:transposase
LAADAHRMSEQNNDRQVAPADAEQSMCEDLLGPGVGNHVVRLSLVLEQGGPLMSIVCGLDLHRQQVTFDVFDSVSGEVWRGRVWQPDRERFQRWLRRDVAGRANGEPVAMAVEGCTGWRYVVEEIVAAGFEAHVAEPADTQAKRGKKRRAKTDRSDAQLLRELLQRGELPESWIPPTAVLEWRERGCTSR